MKNIQFWGSALIMAAVLSLTSCANDEPLSGGNGNTAGGQTAGALTFSASYGDETADDVVKRTYYGTPNGTSIPVYWSNDDLIKIYSPASADNTQKAQIGIYTTASVGDEQAYAEFGYFDGETQKTDALGTDGLKQAIRPHSSGAQSFYAYYPSTTKVAESGVATYNIPKDQSTESVAAAAAMADQTGYVSDFAASVAVIKDLSMEEEVTNIAFTFYDIMNVLRMQVNNPKEYTVTGITITSPKEEYVSGQVTVTPTATNTYTTEVSNGSQTVDDAKQVTAVPATAAQKEEEQFYNFYLAPQEYTSGITITITYIDQWGYTREWSNTTQPFARGTVKDVVINIEECDCPAGGRGIATPLCVDINAKDMGIEVVSHIASSGLVRTVWIGNGTTAWGIRDLLEDDIELEDNIEAGVVDEFTTSAGDYASSKEAAEELYGPAKTLYFANGNLHIDDGSGDDYDAALAAGNMGYIESIANAAAVGTLTKTSGYGVDTKNFGLFKWGDIGVFDTPHADIADIQQHISGDARYDIARKQLGNGWRLPTMIEWAFLVNRTTQAVATGVSWDNHYTRNGFEKSPYSNNIATALNSGVFTITSNVDGKGTLYLPAVGQRSTDTPVDRGSLGCYWSGSFAYYDWSSSDPARARNLNFSFSSSLCTMYTNTRIHALAVRPVSE